MGIGFSRDLEEARRDNERRYRNEDMEWYREHQHELDVKRERKATNNFKNLLTGQELQPLMNVCMSYLKEHTEHVKASRKRREIRFKEERRLPHPDGRPGPWIPPQQVYRRGPNGPRRRYHSPPPGAEVRYPPRGPPPNGIGDFNPDEGDDHYGGGAGDVPPPSYHTHQRAQYGLRPPNDHAYDRSPPHRPGRRPRPRYPDVDPRYLMHGGLGPGDERFPPQERRQPRGARRTRGGHHAYGRHFGDRGRRARHERGGGSESEEEAPGSGSGSGPGTGMEGRSNAGSENSDGGRRGMPPRRGMRRGGGSQ